MGKMNSFIKQFVALVQGDDATVQAEKAYRSASAALTAHIAVAKADLLGHQEEVEKAKETLTEARLNSGKVISNRDNYVDALVNAKNALLKAEDALEAHEEYIAFLEAELEVLNS
jgi:tetratricopeptide (TPR) repeat protein